MIMLPYLSAELLTYGVPEVLRITPPAAWYIRKSVGPNTERIMYDMITGSEAARLLALGLKKY